MQATMNVARIQPDVHRGRMVGRCRRAASSRFEMPAHRPTAELPNDRRLAEPIGEKDAARKHPHATFGGGE
jgi:hypothetical protein